MMSITDPECTVWLGSKLEESHNTRLKFYGELMDETTEMVQSHRQFVKSAHDSCIKDDDMLFETLQTFKKDIEQMRGTLKQNQRVVSQVTNEIQQKEMEKDEIVQKIEKLKLEHSKRNEAILSKNKANKAKLKNLQKSRLVFQEHLGLEVRTVLGQSQLAQGKNLQFVFRNINPSDLDSAYIVTMGLKEDGVYQIVSSDPKLECMPALERRLQETMNLSAFLANVRKEFISLVRC